MLFVLFVVFWGFVYIGFIFIYLLFCSCGDKAQRHSEVKEEDDVKDISTLRDILKSSSSTFALDDSSPVQGADNSTRMSVVTGQGGKP